MCVCVCIGGIGVLVRQECGEEGVCVFVCVRVCVEGVSVSASRYVSDICFVFDIFSAATSNLTHVCVCACVCVCVSVCVRACPSTGGMYG